MEIITVKGLNFSYPQSATPALKEVNLSVRQGEFILLCGETGCGKTTLLKLLKREIAPHGEKSGEIYLDGVNLSDLDARSAASDIGIVMQNPELQIVTDKVWHELAFGLESLGYPQSVIRRRVGEFSSFFGISDWFEKNTADLSGGQKQLLNLASVMVMRPKVLLLDEPTSQLDPVAAAEFIAVLQRLTRELGLTVILTEHRTEEIFPICDRVAVMRGGTIVLCEEPEKAAQSKAIPSLPVAARIYGAFRLNDKCPLTIMQGRDFLQRHFKNDVTSISEEDKPRGKTVLEAKNLWFRYEKKENDVLKSLSLKLCAGEVLSILGGNAAGKSTALRVLSGQRRPNAGRVMAKGNIVCLPQDLQTVFLEPEIYRDCTELAERTYGPEEARGQIERLALRLRITHLLYKHPYDISGGELQKAAIMKALLARPDILMLDEPTKGLDAASKNALGEIFKEIKTDISVVIVTHDVEFAAQYSDRCALFFDGAVISEDAPRAFFSDNSFYTTAASRISRHMYKNAVTCEDVVRLCKENGVSE